MALIKWGSSGRTINRVLVEDYVRGVVPAEMPTSWPADAVRAQAVAARSYAVRLRANRRYPSYDLCDTTACQVYRGMSAETHPRGRRGPGDRRHDPDLPRHRRPDPVRLLQRRRTAPRATIPYLRPQPDPYDGAVRSQAWTRTITATDIERRWPSVGTLRGVRGHQPRRSRRLGWPGRQHQDHRQPGDGHGVRLDLPVALRAALAAVHPHRCQPGAGP